MTTRSTSGDGLQWAESVHTPVAPGAIETDWSGWQSWLDSYLNIERKKARDTFAEVYEALGNACIELHDEIERVEQQVAELRGAMDVMRSLGHAGLRMRGKFDAAADYLAHDVVTHNGSSFVAKRDKPGTCPGEGWELLASKGDRGERGERGPRGQIGHRGQPAPAIKHWLISKEKFTASPILSDGTIGKPLELKGLFQEFLDQTRAGA
jgi:hypothetical protein